MASVAMRVKAREVESGVHLPYLRHVTEHVISLSTRALITTIRLSGVSFETADAADLNDLHAKLNLTLRNIADERLALWTHVIRRRAVDYPDGAFRSDFARELDEAYRARLVSETLYRNDLYLTLVWHPGRDPAERASLFFSRLGRAQRAGAEVDSHGLKKLDDVTRELMAALDRYRPRPLGLVERHGVVFSETGTFLQQLVACERLPFPLVEGRIGPALYANRLIFGRETIEIRSPGGSRFAGMLAFKDYPATTRPGLLDGLLAAPFELVLAQSFAFLGKAEAKTVMTRKQNQLLSANDPALRRSATSTRRSTISNRTAS